MILWNGTTGDLSLNKGVKLHINRFRISYWSWARNIFLIRYKILFFSILYSKMTNKRRERRKYWKLINLIKLSLWNSLFLVKASFKKENNTHLKKSMDNKALYPQTLCKFCWNPKHQLVLEAFRSTQELRNIKK